MALARVEDLGFFELQQIKHTGQGTGSGYVFEAEEKLSGSTP
tara:strand:+ start:1912 stop:2037 length:126 start_codon:yes stop_codon:yes gene_type:complete